MTDPWLKDACSLVDAMRAGELTPLDALEASLKAIENSQLNALSWELLFQPAVILTEMKTFSNSCLL